MKTVIALIGKIACGKDYAGEYLAQRLQGKSLGISSSLRIIAQQRNIQATRENLIMIGKELAEKYGDGYLAEILVKNNPEKVLIITGPRQLGQLQYLRKNTKSIFVAIDADAKIRYERMKQRGKFGEKQTTFEEFCRVEEMEESTVQRVSDCMALADIVLENNGTLQEFNEKLDELISSIGFERTEL